MGRQFQSDLGDMQLKLPYPIIRSAKEAFVPQNRECIVSIFRSAKEALDHRRKKNIVIINR
ncbi:hypothetical protein D3H64_02285 [Atopobacter sp. AH10]|nr:hypothetical protein D3H64_02285 [Atopobacter sp. AH10]